MAYFTQSAALETVELLRKSSAAFVIQSPSQVNSMAALPPPTILHAPPTPPTTQCLLRSGTTPSSQGADTLELELAQCRAALRESEQRNRASQEIIDAQNCTIALQAAGFQAQQQKLAAKEGKKQSHRDKLLATKVGRHLSGEEFRAAVRADDEERAIAAKKRLKARDARTTLAQLRKARRAWREKERAKRKTKHEEALEQWRKACVECRETRKRKPKRPLMPKKASTPPRYKSPVVGEEEKENDDEGADELDSGAVTDTD